MTELFLRESVSSESSKRLLRSARMHLCGRVLVANPLFGGAIMVWLLVLNGGVNQIVIFSAFIYNRLRLRGFETSSVKL